MSKSWKNIYRDNLWNDLSCCPEFDDIVSLCDGKDKKILDIGCAYGRLTIPLARDGFRVVGIDIADEPIKILKEKAANLSNLEAYQASFNQLPFSDNMFDGCIAINSLYHGSYNEIVLAIKEIERVLVAGGWLYGTFLSKEDWKYMKGTQLDKDTFLSCGGPDAGIPHWFASKSELSKLFCNWNVLSIELENTVFESQVSSHWKIISRIRS